MIDHDDAGDLRRVEDSTWAMTAFRDSPVVPHRIHAVDDRRWAGIGPDPKANHHILAVAALLAVDPNETAQPQLIDLDHIASGWQLLGDNEVA
jgi:hypothetical protein